MIELLVIVAMIALISSVAYPRITDTLRKMRARDGAKAIVNAVLVAKAEAMIRNLAHRITLTPSSSIGAIDRTNGGGSVVIERGAGNSCNFGALTEIDRFRFATLGDVSLCKLRTTSVGEINAASACDSGATTLCVTPDGTVTNVGATAAGFTVAYVRENERSGSAASGVGVVRQIVIPRRKAPKVNPVQVTADVCL